MSMTEQILFGILAMVIIVGFVIIEYREQRTKEKRLSDAERKADHACVSIEFYEEDHKRMKRQLDVMKRQFEWMNKQQATHMKKMIYVAKKEWDDEDEEEILYVTYDFEKCRSVVQSDRNSLTKAERQKINHEICHYMAIVEDGESAPAAYDRITNALKIKDIDLFYYFCDDDYDDEDDEEEKCSYE